MVQYSCIVFNEIRQELREVMCIPLQCFLELLSLDVSSHYVTAGRHLVVGNTAFDLVRRQ